MPGAMGNTNSAASLRRCCAAVAVAVIDLQAAVADHDGRRRQPLDLKAATDLRDARAGLAEVIAALGAEASVDG
jgi:hypothetical protein